MYFTDEELRQAVAWYQFHLEIYKAGKSGNLSASESGTLEELIDRRDHARRTLVLATSV